MDENERIGLTIKQKLIGRELDRFFSAKDGTGDNNLDQMADALENLNTLISNDLSKENKSYITERIKKVLHWFRTLENNPKAYVNTPEGYTLKGGVHHKANQVLTKYFTILKDYVENLGLLN